MPNLINDNDAMTIVKSSIPKEYKGNKEKEQEYLAKVFSCEGVLAGGSGYDMEKLYQAIDTVLEELQNAPSTRSTPPTSTRKKTAEKKAEAKAREPPKQVPTTTDTVDEEPQPIDEEIPTDLDNYVSVPVNIDSSEEPFSNYPQELRTVLGWMIDYNKVPINDQAIMEILPPGDELNNLNGKGKRYLGKWKSGELCRDLTAAVSDLSRIRKAYAKKYPGDSETPNKFGLGLLGKKFPKLLFFEWDDVWVRKEGQIVRSQDGKQYVENNTYGQLEFYQHCLEKGYHVAKSFSGNMHYVMELPECMENLPSSLLDSKNGGGFKWMDGKDSGDFEIANNHNSQWNETGYTLSKGTVIPSTDEYAIQFVKARMERTLARTTKASSTKPKASPQAASGEELHSSANGSVATDTVDTKLVEQIRKITKDKLGYYLHKIDIDKDLDNIDLSAELQSMFNLLVMQGVNNYATCYAIADGTAIHRAYKSRSDYKDKWTENKLRRTFEKAFRDVGTRIFRASKNKEGDTRNEIIRAVQRFNELENNAIFYSDVSKGLVKLLDDGRVIEMDFNDLLCELTTSDYIWVDDNGKETKPTIAAIKSCINLANLPKLYYRTCGGWVTRDGEIICSKGYHDGFYLNNDIQVKPIPNEIDFNVLRQAREILERPFRDVKFKNQDGLEDTIYFLFMMFLHPSVLHALPGFMINKNKAGIGGSTFAKILLQLRHNVSINDPVGLVDTENATRDIITAELTTHETGYANFDNLLTTKVLGIPGLMLHSGEGIYKDRMKYGKHTTGVDTKKDVIYNGNNIIIAADFCRRVLEVRLFWQGDTTTIKFGKDGKDAAERYEKTMQYVATKHSEVLWAIGVAVNHWIREGRQYPKVVPTSNWDEFKAYHKIVGGAMDSLGYSHYLQHLHETQLDNNYAINVDKEKIETLRQAFRSGQKGQQQVDGTMEYETINFCSADLYAAMHPSRIDIADVQARIRQFEYEDKAYKDGKRELPPTTAMPSSYYSSDLQRLFGDVKGKSITAELQRLVDVGIITGCNYVLRPVNITTHNYKWFRVMTVHEFMKANKENTNQEQ